MRRSWHRSRYYFWNHPAKVRSLTTGRLCCLHLNGNNWHRCHPCYPLKNSLPKKLDLTAAEGGTSATSGAVLFHAHCHQKALWGQQAMQELLTHFAGERGQVLPTGCCGLAGAFGYGQKRYELSKAIFAAQEFDPIRTADKDQIVLATGTSCRAQIRHFSSHSALHPVEWLDQVIHV